MQEKNEKISGIMADDDKCGSSIDSLINKLLFEISKETEEDFKKQTIQSTTLRLELANEDDHDIDKEITELETLIKRLQAEIVEMSETASKPSYCPSFSVTEENSASPAEASYASPEILNQEKPENDIGFPIISKDDSILEQQVKMFAEDISNIRIASSNTSPHKNYLDDVRRNFNTLWEDPTKNNLDLTEKPEETISSPLSTAFNFFIMPSTLETKKPMFSNNISIESIKYINNEALIENMSTESIKSINNKALIENISKESIKSINNKALMEQSENISEFYKGASPNDTRDDDQKISADNKLLGNSTDNDDISGGVSELAADNIINNVAMLLSAEPPYNLPGNIENHPSSVIDTTVPKDTIISLPKLATMKAVKTTIIKTLENLTSSDNTCTTDTPEMKQTLNVTRENAISKTDSILKSFNRKILQIVGRGSEKSISKEKHKSEDFSDKDVSVEFRKAFPRSRSEPSKNVSTPDDDSSIIDPKKTSLSTESDSPSIKFIRTNLRTAVYNEMPINTPNGPQTQNIGNINDIPTTPDLSKKNPEQDSSVSITSSDISNAFPTIFDSNVQTGAQQEHVMKVEIPINNNPNSPQTQNIGNINDIPTPDLSKKNPEQDTSASIISSSISSAFPKLLDPNLQTSGQQENVMKVEIPINNNPNSPQTQNIGNINDIPTPDLSKKNPEQDTSASIIRSSISSAFPKLLDPNLQTSGQQENVMNFHNIFEATIVKGTAEESVEKKKMEQDVEAEEDEDDSDDEKDEDDDNDNTYDVD